MTAMTADSRKNTSGGRPRFYRIATVIGIVLCAALIPLLVVNVTLIAKSLIWPEKIPDFNATIHIVSFSFHGHNATYWNGALQSVEIPGGFMGFGDILMGMDADEAASKLGEPSEREEYGWFFIHERDEIQLEIDRKPAGKGYRVTGLHYRRVVYD